MKGEADLRKLNPRKGDLVLLVSEQFKDIVKPRLLVFESFLNQENSDGAVIIRGPNDCYVDASRMIILHPEIDVSEFKFPNPVDSTISGSYSVDHIYVGAEDIINALREMPGYESYADLLLIQSGKQG